ncbi:MgtC/SapB family protein [Hymenobacter sp. BRD67]|uniref:MgtC/SapB family protein n=1 Tax=Hymenobacter sp. BRD67 TaxID=2675877 RepID=UPI00156571AD|nr:MgtC/SapB family protein [Hymenobacter sp. BRD67]QKG51878.1 MgtC/SapB family protein [Hymenobacter sp. BRD67]
MQSAVLVQFEFRLALALVLGAVLGLERQLHHRTAGTRTNALVALGAALFVLMAQSITNDASAPGRVAGQVITGIGFLGAGAILREGTTIVGLTTAATVWCAAGIGTLAGLGSWYEACVGTLFILTANVLLRPLDSLINRFTAPAALAPATQDYRVRIELLPALPAGAGPPLPAVLALLNSWHLLTLRVTETTPPVVQATLRLPTDTAPFGQLLAALAAVPGVAQVSGEPLMALATQT